ncbi:MAG: hypothetical protein R3F30_13290 [Planctomycetota bacterium]
MTSTTPTLTLAALLALATVGRTQDTASLYGLPFGTAASSAPAALEPLTIRLDQSTDPTRVELSGGRPGEVAILVFGSRHLDGSSAMHGLVAPEATTSGAFDAAGRFVADLRGRPEPGVPVCVQGFSVRFGGDGNPTWSASAGLDIEAVDDCLPVTAPAPTPTLGLDDVRALLRFEVGPSAMPALDRELRERDLAGALTAALNSAGDSLTVKVGGKLMVPIPTPPPIKVGGSVAFSVVAARTDDGFTLTVAADVAVLCGAKVPKFDVGLEGGSGYGLSTVYAFRTAREAADGIVDFALLTAIGHRGASEAHVQAAGMARRAWAAYVQVQRRLADAVRLPRALRRPAVERALSRLRAARSRAFQAVTRGLEVAEQIVTRLHEAEAFLRTHQVAYGISYTTMAKASLKLEQEGVFEVGGELSGARRIGIQIVKRDGQRIERVELKAESSTALELAAVMTVGAKLTCKRTFGVATSFARGADGRLGHEETRFGITSETEVCLLEKSLVDVKAGVGRQTSISFDALAFGSAHVEAFRSLASGSTAGLAALAGIEARIEVQDHVVRGLERELAPTADCKLSAELGWSDQGPQRRLELDAADLVRSLCDVEARAQEARDLVAEARTTLQGL